MAVAPPPNPLLFDSVVCSCFPPIAVGEFFFFFFKTGSLAFISFFIRLQLFSDILYPAAALAFLLQSWLHLLLLFRSTSSPLSIGLLGIRFHPFTLLSQ